MAEITFTHKFFGWLDAEARRHVNPDGSQGAIVALTAKVAKGLTLSASVEIGPRAIIGGGASIGDGASIGPRASIGYDASIGDGASIGPRASIGYDASIGPRASIGYDASIGPRASIGGGASIGDGASIGPRASIGYDASIGPRASIGGGASIGYDASIGPRASIGGGASIGKDDWFMSVGPLGSDARYTTIVHKKGGGLRFWTGCFQNKTADEFRAAIAETHGDNEHAKAYLWMLDAIERHPDVVARAAIAKATGDGQ